MKADQIHEFCRVRALRRATSEFAAGARTQKANPLSQVGPASITGGAMVRWTRPFVASRSGRKNSDAAPTPQAGCFLRAGGATRYSVVAAGEGEQRRRYT